MTRDAFTRCTHCHDRYIYGVSGFHCNDHRSKVYCKTCLEAVQGALAKVPKKFEPRWVSVTELPQFQNLTLEEVLGWELEDRRANEGKLQVQRIWPGMVNMETGDTFSLRQVKGRGRFSGVFFQVGTWSMTTERYTIKVEMEVDLQTGKLTGHHWE